MTCWHNEVAEASFRAFGSNPFPYTPRAACAHCFRRKALAWFRPLTGRPGGAKLRGSDAKGA